MQDKLVERTYPEPGHIVLFKHRKSACIASQIRLDSKGRAKKVRQDAGSNIHAWECYGADRHMTYAAGVWDTEKAPGAQEIVWHNMCLTEVSIIAALQTSECRSCILFFTCCAY